jgi:hypothetical protein
MEHEEEEDHWGEQATIPPDLEEEGEHREQGTQLTPTEGDHREEQGGCCGLVTKRASWPRRWLKNWSRGVSS